MRWALNLLYLLPGEVGGTETYAAGLLDGLAAAAPEDEFVVFVNSEASGWPLPPAGRFERVVCPVRASSRLARYRFEQLRLPGLLRRHSVQLVHSLGYVAPLLPGVPSVVSVLDLNFRALRDAMPWARRMALELFVGGSARRADHVITISEFGRREVLSAYRVDPNRVTAVLLAGGDGRPRSAAPSPVNPGYVVAFSSPFPHKNISRLAAAMRIARERQGVTQRLVVVGHRPPEAPAEPWIEYTGYLDSSLRDAVVAGADLLAFPSLYEGFGLPVLEAMALGVPVASSSAASLPEVGGDAAVYFDPTSAEDMASVIASLAADPERRLRLREAGWRNLARFSWRRTAEQTLAVYRSVLQRRALA